MQEHKRRSPKPLTRNVSLDAEHEAAVQVLAIRAGHLNRSRVIRDAIEEMARRELGDAWRDELVVTLVRAGVAA